MSLFPAKVAKLGPALLISRRKSSFRNTLNKNRHNQQSDNQNSWLTRAKSESLQMDKK